MFALLRMIWPEHLGPPSRLIGRIEDIGFDTIPFNRYFLMFLTQEELSAHVWLQQYLDQVQHEFVRVTSNLSSE